MIALCSTPSLSVKIPQAAHPYLSGLHWRFVRRFVHQFLLAISRTYGGLLGSRSHDSGDAHADVDTP